MTTASQDEDPRVALLRGRYERSLGKIGALFGTGRADGSAYDGDGAHAGSTLGDRSAKRRQYGYVTSDDSAKLDGESLTTRELKHQGVSEQSSKLPQPQSERTQQQGASDRVAAPPTATAMSPGPAPRKVDDDYDEFDEDDGEDEDGEGNKEDGNKTEQSNAPHDGADAAPLSTADSNLPLTATNGLTTEPDPTSIDFAQKPHSPRDQASPPSPAQPQTTAEDIRKKLEADKKTLEDTVKRSFHTLFFTLENDRDAMLDQQKLEESERQVEAEMSSNSHSAANAASNGIGGGGPGARDKNNNGVSNPAASSFLLSSNQKIAPLNNVTFGSSSLPLKNLIERIDLKRSEVAASDAELRSLMNEVRKNRSKWANEDRVGQEELYDNAESVLDMLKGMTEHSAPFLTRVNKRDAPDYYTVIKRPMDLGTMTKKLKALQYKSKQEFIDDLNLIWANCLKYNTNPSHFLRKHALYLRKETERLSHYIPDVVVRDRAEVEAEERRIQRSLLDGDDDEDNGEESDDEPLLASRGRTAGKKRSKKGTAPARNVSNPSVAASANGGGGNANTGGTPVPEGLSQTMSTTVRTSSDDLFGTMTPSPGNVGNKGTVTPATSNGIGNGMDSGLFGRGSSSGPGDGNGDGLVMDGGAPPSSKTTAADAPGTHVDPSNPAESSPSSSSIPSVSVQPFIDFEDPEYKVWKQLTQKDRARFASDRHRLFHGEQINPEAGALLRTKAGMKRWLRNQEQSQSLDEGGRVAASGSSTVTDSGANSNDRSGTGARAADASGTGTSGETLAEEMIGDESENAVGGMLPDYYDVLSAIPDIPPQLHWVEDSEGNVVDMSEESLRLLPKGSFASPASSKFAKKMHANLRTMQESRKLCSKISIVRQMHVQSQMYQNQFQKYDPQPFVDEDHDTPAHVMNHNGPLISPYTCRAALQRSVGKVFYNAGFEECQPSALDAATDMAADFFQKLGITVKKYFETPSSNAASNSATAQSSSTMPAATNHMVLANMKKPLAPAHSPSAIGVPQSFGNNQIIHRPARIKRNMEEILTQTLSSIGAQPETLEAYVKEDLDRLTGKLNQMRDRLKAYFTELLRPAFSQQQSNAHAHAQNNNNNNLVSGTDAFDTTGMFADGSEAFVSGDFAVDIDEDFFGFRELGLESEFGLATLAVPLHLLQNQIYKAAQATNPHLANDANRAAEPALPFPPPPPYPPISRANVREQIGLMQGFFLEKLRAAYGDEGDDGGDGEGDGNDNNDANEYNDANENNNNTNNNKKEKVKEKEKKLAVGKINIPPTTNNINNTPTVANPDADADAPSLIEDLDLHPKQRYGPNRPRLPASGKIALPAGLGAVQHAGVGAGGGAGGGGGSGGAFTSPLKRAAQSKLKPSPSKRKKGAA